MTLMIAFWFPYDFRIDASFARARLAALEQLPLFGLFAGSELRAIGNILQKSALYIPLGMLLGRACVDRKGSKSIIAVLIAVTWGLLLPLGIELGQLLLPDKYPDATDWLLALCGVTVGGVVVTGSFSARPFASRNERGPGIGRWLVAWAAASGLVATVTHLPGVPYNVREALDPALGAFGPVTFGAFLMWMVAFQIVTPRSLPPRKPGRGFYYWPTMLLVHSIIGTLMLSVAATRESLEDIAGSPVLGWAGNIELLARTSVLIAATSWLFLGGSLFASRREAGRSRRQLFLIWLTISIGLLPLFYWISIDQAATDNLTELVAGNGAPWATALIALWAVLVSAAGASLSQLGRNSRWFASVAVVLASIAVGFVLLQAGMAPAIVKYGQAFSGLQFLLSPDRTHYVDWSSLFLRYSLVHLTLVVAIAVCREWLDPARVRSNVLAGSSDKYQRQQHAEASGIRRNF